MPLMQTGRNVECRGSGPAAAGSHVNALPADSALTAQGEITTA
jgi:hypothetical protein